MYIKYYKTWTSYSFLHCSSPRSRAKLAAISEYLFAYTMTFIVSFYPLHRMRSLSRSILRPYTHIAAMAIRLDVPFLFQGYSYRRRDLLEYNAEETEGFFPWTSDLFCAFNKMKPWKPTWKHPVTRDKTAGYTDAIQMMFLMGTEMRLTLSLCPIWTGTTSDANTRPHVKTSGLWKPWSNVACIVFFNSTPLNPLLLCLYPPGEIFSQKKLWKDYLKVPSGS